jgi:dipeptidyl aminopeptidase/acylaminoacyl peptidase
LRVEIATGDTALIAEDPRYDVIDAIISPETHEVQAVIFEKDRTDVLVVDESIRDDVGAIKAAHPGDFFIASRDDADDTWLIGFTTDDGPVPFYSYDRNTKQAAFLFDHRPDLKEYTLAPMEPVEFESRDGLTLHGYVSFPPGLARENLPMVLNVHGGPWARDTWGFNAETQWFANRGYVCLQVNYRGSTGYGKEHLNAGDREWGGKMHDDLIDAVNWAVSQGYVDRKRIAIYGASYGGYAALVGATFTPDAFCCAVDAFGPSNLTTFMNSIPPYWSAVVKILRSRIGDPSEAGDFLRSRSPLFKVDQIKIPMLIAQGANDPRVTKAETDRIVDALKKNSVDYEYLVFDDEGHGFARPENSLRFYAKAEEFLSKHLGGRFEQAYSGSQP